MRRRARNSNVSNGRGGMYRFWIRYRNSNDGNVVQEEARPPPSYDNIYSTSMDINPLPSYSTAIHLKSLETDENKINNDLQNETNTNAPVNIESVNINSTHDIINSNNSSILNGELNLAYVDDSSVPNADNSSTTKY